MVLRLRSAGAPPLPLPPPSHVLPAVALFGCVVTISGANFHAGGGFFSWGGGGVCWVGGGGACFLRVSCVRLPFLIRGLPALGFGFRVSRASCVRWSNSRGSGPRWSPSRRTHLPPPPTHSPPMMASDGAHAGCRETMGDYASPAHDEPIGVALHLCHTWGAQCAAWARFGALCLHRVGTVVTSPCDWVLCMPHAQGGQTCWVGTVFYMSQLPHRAATPCRMSPWGRC